MKLLVSGILAFRRLDEVRYVECLSGSMAQTYKFIIARVNDDDGPIDSYGLCPCLREIDMSALLRWA
jgi:hypothetical protein